MPSFERTIVGVPLHEKETPEGIDITLRNIDQQLNMLGIDAPVILQVNGPRTAEGVIVDIGVDKNKYNSEIEIVRSEEKGQIRAIDDLLGKAAVRGIERAFITDADIHRMPGSMKAMWESSNSALVGAQYRPYPIQVVEHVFGELSYEDRLLYQIFDGDQTPQAQAALQKNGYTRQKRVKGSLMLLDVATATGMHDDQTYAADSVMNRIIGRENSTIADNAHFLHMGRVSMTDHIKARLRHFKAASARHDLDGFLRNEVSLPHEVTMNRIAADIRANNDDGDFYAMLYLSRCAVRERVTEICTDISLEKWDINTLGRIDPISMHDIVTYADAKQAVSRFFLDIDWQDVYGSTTGPPSITQEQLRQPLDFEALMADCHLAKYVFKTLGITPVVPTTS